MAVVAEGAKEPVDLEDDEDEEEEEEAEVAFAVLLEGALDVTAGDGAEVTLAPGDAIRVEPMERGTWRLGNPGLTDALFAVVPMPPVSSAASQG